jgi:hypothetical protein
MKLIKVLSAAALLSLSFAANASSVVYQLGDHPDGKLYKQDNSNPSSLRHRLAANDGRVGRGWVIPSTGAGGINKSNPYSLHEHLAASIGRVERGSLMSSTRAGGTNDFLGAKTVVPVPAAVWLLGSALGGLGFMRRRKAS